MPTRPAGRDLVDSVSGRAPIGWKEQMRNDRSPVHRLMLTISAAIDPLVTLIKAAFMAEAL